MLETLMSRIYLAFASVRDREEGQAMVEYALILTLVSIAAIGVLGTIGDDIVTKLGEVVTALT